MSIIPTQLYDKLREEERIQAGMVEYLELILPRYTSQVIWFHVPNQRMGKLARIICKYLGVLAGVPDLVFVGGWRKETEVGFIEVKKPGGRLSVNQKKFRDWCDKLGIPYAVCHSIAELQEMLEEWGML